MKNIKGLRESAFMYKMNSICSSNLYVYKKRVYNNNTNGYQNWFLFVNNINKLIENVEDVFTVQIESSQVQNTFQIKSSQVQNTNQIESTQVQKTDQNQIEYDILSQKLIQALSPASTPVSPVLSPASLSPASLSPASLSPALSSPASSTSPASTSPASTPPASSTFSASSIPHHHTTHSQFIPSQSLPHQQIPINLQTYFHSKLARNLFGYTTPKNDEENNKDVRDIIYERILKMREGAFTYSGWRNVMEDNDENNKCGVRFVHNIKMKCKFVFHALTVFLERKEIDHSLTWKGACKKAVEKIK